ncbi:uncharacterized protein LOC126678803 [Mercurialis annua]|nr:uncharacterized protein LOC126678803 [Mercurialis annua]
MGLNFIAHGKYQVYKELTREFYTTLNYASKNEKAISFRIKGVDYSIGYDFMNQKLKLPKGGIRGCPSNFDVNRVWKQLTGEDSVDLQQAPNGLIIEPSYLIFHKFLCHSICGKKESNRVTKDDLLVLDYLVRRSAKSVDFIHLIFKSMMTMATSSKVALGNGHLVTCIALLHSAIDEDDLHKMECLGDAYLNETMLRKADILDMDGELMNVKDRNCYLIKTGQPRRGKGRKAEIEDDCDEDEDNVSRELETENGQGEVVRDDVGIDQPREEEVRRPRKPKRRGAFEEEVLSLLNETKSRLTNIETSIEEIKREQRRSHRRWKACFGTLGAHDPSPPHTPES